MQKWIIASLLLVATAGGAYWALQGPADETGGASTARGGDTPRVGFDWVLADGELLVGTEEMNVPVGMDVVLEIDNDRADTLLISGYDARFELAADSIVPVAFHTHKLGTYTLRLGSSPRTVARLTVVAAQN